MSRSAKDGRHRGGHVDHLREVWSRRCRKVSMWTLSSVRSGRSFKWYTHRYERRVAKREIRDELVRL